MKKMEGQKQTQLTAQEEKHLETLGAGIKKLQKQLDIEMKNAEPLQNDIKTLKDQLSQAGGMKVKLQKSKVESLSQQIDTLSDRKTKAEVQLNTQLKAYPKLQKTLAAAEEAIEKLTASQEEKEEQLRDLRCAAKLVKQKVLEAEAVVDTKIEEMERLQGVYEDAKAESTSKRTKLVTLTQVKPFP